MFKATYEGPTFSFEAYGYTESQARAFLMKGLRKHSRQYLLRTDWFEEDDINCCAIKTGVTYRDREEI